jgi:Carbohydrate binding domain (family 11)
MIMFRSIGRVEVERLLARGLPWLAIALSMNLASACVGVSEQQSAAAPEPAAANAGAATPAAPAAQAAPVQGAGPKVCTGATQPAGDGLLDDFEDGNTQLAPLGGRDGYFWTTKDPKGSTLEPSSDFKPSDGGAGGSQKALHASGKIATGPDAWGIGVGANLVGTGTYDASKYAGISFKAKVGEKSTKAVRFKIGDVNTHQSGGICSSCWNHFGKDLTLSTEWKEYTVRFSETKQAVGWGKPRPPTLTPSQLVSIDWSIGASGQDYDLWVDDIQFVECK